jgi:hypothetical protein
MTLIPYKKSGRPPKKLSAATKWLRQVLSTGPKTVQWLKAHSKAQNHTWMTIRRCRPVLNVYNTIIEMEHFWTMPSGPAIAAPVTEATPAAIELAVSTVEPIPEAPESKKAARQKKWDDQLAARRAEVLAAAIASQDEPDIPDAKEGSIDDFRRRLTSQCEYLIENNVPRADIRLHLDQFAIQIFEQWDDRRKETRYKFKPEIKPDEERVDDIIDKIVAKMLKPATEDFDKPGFD